MSKLIKNAENKEEAIAIAELGTTYKRTGFHFDKKLEKIGSTIKYFKKNSELSFCQNEHSKTHKLIIGDNYDALLNLSISYNGKIDVIYIDPPYGKDDMGEFADTNYNNAITRDNLLSMLYPRLVLAKQLLSDEGVIFCSIDDKNQAYIKCLFDEVFGEKNCLTFISRATGTPTGGGFEGFVNEADYLLVYAKYIENVSINGLTMTEKDSKIYDQEDESGRYLIRPLRRTGGEDRREDRPTMYYPLTAPDGTKIYPKGPTGYDSRWICSEDKAKELNDSNLLLWKKIKKNNEFQWQVYQKFYLDNRTKKPGNLWTDIEGNKKATRELREIFNNEKIFLFPKPVDLLNFCISILDRKCTW